MWWDSRPPSIFFTVMVKRPSSRSGGDEIV